VELVRAFRIEKKDPDRFYRLLAADSVHQLERHAVLAEKFVVDVGGGAGYFSSEFREMGARCVLVEPELLDIRRECSMATSRPGAAVVGDGYHLPLPSEISDVCFSSNVLEHVPDPQAFIREMVRVTKPGGLVYVAFTNWYSPWGGHGTAPWHYFGGEWALRRYKRVYGREPVNRFKVNLFPTHIGPVLRWLRSWPAVHILEAAPRYYPSWCNWVVRVPGLREIATWNLMLILRRAGGSPYEPLAGSGANGASASPV
jgi:SAM-dependent methyltransferase